MINMTPEQEARVNIDRLLEQAGWAVQDADSINLYASNGVAVREFSLKSGHGKADYLLYVNLRRRAAAGAGADGHGKRQDLHGLQSGVSADQVRRC